MFFCSEVVGLTIFVYHLYFCSVLLGTWKIKVLFESSPIDCRKTVERLPTSGYPLDIMTSL